MLKVRLLGRFEITKGKKPIIITARSAQSLFAYLIFNGGTSYRREKLAAYNESERSNGTARDLNAFPVYQRSEWFDAR